MAAALFKQRLQSYAAFSNWKVESAGLRGLNGQPADINAQLAMEIYGLDISQHIARRINRTLIGNYDLLITMERQHQEALLTAFPEVGKQVFFIGDLAGIDQDVEDPIGQPVDAYLDAAKLIKQLLGKTLIDILLLAQFFWLKSNLSSNEVPEAFKHLEVKNLIQKMASEDPVQVGIAGSEKYPDVFRYDILHLLMDLFPRDERPLEVLQSLANKTPPSEEEMKWLQLIQVQAVVTPYTCLAMMNERKFVHPDVQAELDALRSQLSDPGYAELYKELENLYRKNFTPYKYRLNIWDLSTKYHRLPYKIGDYEQAYARLKGLS